jgi:hypothetical protein
MKIINRFSNHKVRQEMMGRTLVTTPDDSSGLLRDCL